MHTWELPPTSNLQEANVHSKVPPRSSPCHNHSTLQWGYYGGGHAGICFRFEITPETDFTQVSQVYYRRKRPRVDVEHFYDNRTDLTRLLLVKDKAWKHECEVRAISHPSGEYKYPHGMLTGIILGAKIDPAEENAVRSAVATSGITLEMLRVQPRTRTHGVDIVAA